jgi:1-aminocyclopropane-1-carboxylate deaminase
VEISMSKIEVLPLLLPEKFPVLQSLTFLRLDLPDPVAGGNKRYKLKYNIEDFLASGRTRILTFGGAFSNHIAAAATACARLSIPSIGIIRGDELTSDANPVLQSATKCGMELHFVSREEYRLRNDSDYTDTLQRRFPDAFIVPEGGTNDAAVRGCEEILSEATSFARHIFLPVGTGGTISGIIRSLQPHQKAHGVAVVASEDALKSTIARLSGKAEGDHWELYSQYTYGGYGKTQGFPPEFIEHMKIAAGLPLDFVYSGKALYATLQIIQERGYNPSECLFVHTGGYAFMPQIVPIT